MSDKIKVLIVDDEELIVNLLKSTISNEEMDIICVADGMQALEYAKSHELDLVISDIMMPKLKGTKLFYELKKIDPFIEVILITGYPAIKDIKEMLENGVSDFIIKPFNLDKVKEVVSDTVKKVKRWREFKKMWDSGKG